MTRKKKNGRIDVEVIVSTHTHASKKCAIGDTINVTEVQAERLRKAGVVK